MTDCPSEDCHTNVKKIDDAVRRVCKAVFTETGSVKFISKLPWPVTSFILIVVIIPFIFTVNNLVYGQKESEYKYASAGEVQSNATEIRLLKQQLEQIIVTLCDVKTTANKNKDEIKKELEKQDTRIERYINELKDLIKARTQ